jgi:hypothetical protein
MGCFFKRTFCPDFPTAIIPGNFLDRFLPCQPSQATKQQVLENIFLLTSGFCSAKRIVYDVKEHLSCSKRSSTATYPDLVPLDDIRRDLNPVVGIRTCV